MSLIVDASVAVKWFVTHEGGLEAAQAILDDESEALLAPDLLLLEVANALGAWPAARLPTDLQPGLSPVEPGLRHLAQRTWLPGQPRARAG